MFMATSRARRRAKQFVCQVGRASIARSPSVCQAATRTKAIVRGQASATAASAGKEALANSALGIQSAFTELARSRSIASAKKVGAEYSATKVSLPFQLLTNSF